MQFFGNKIYHNKSFGTLRENFDEYINKAARFSMSEEDIKTIIESGFIGENEYYGIAESEIPEGNIIKF